MRPRIALVTNSLSGGGAERAVATLANLLAEEPVDVALIPARSGAADLVQPAVEILPLGKEPGSGIGGLRSCLPHFQRVMRDWRPDVVHVHCELPEMLAATLPRRAVRRIVVTEHTREPWRHHPFIGRWTRRRLSRLGTHWLVPQPDMAVWSLSSVVADHVPNPLLDVERRWQPRTGAGPLRLVYVGRLVPLKRVDWLIEAAGRLAGEVELTLIGEGPAQRQLEKQASASGAHVRFAGYLRDPWVEALGHDVMVTASSTEADPMTVAEAILHGMPILASDLAAHRNQGLSGRQLFASPDELVARLTEVRADRSALESLTNPAAATRLRRERIGHAVAAAHLKAYDL